MRTLLIIQVSFFAFIQTAECIRCYSCTDVIDDTDCTSSITCGSGQSCFKSIKDVDGTRKVTMGCLDNQQCSGKTEPNSIVGREINRRQTDTCVECCSSDMCNKDICYRVSPTSCQDDATVDCARLNSIFTICNDIQHARTVCPRFCDLCPGITAPSDCNEIKRHEFYAPDGVYDVVLWKSNRTIKVYCDMTTDGGGWTVFQHRYNGAVDFYQNYSQYVHGFGDLNTEFWLGLDYIKEMTSQYVNELRIDLMSADGSTAYETLSPFSMSANYVLDVGDTVSSQNISHNYRFGPYHRGAAFSTYDKDLDEAFRQCAVYMHGGWWYKHTGCAVANLNGRYLTPGGTNHDGTRYDSFIYTRSLKQTKMSFRRKHV